MEAAVFFSLAVRLPAYSGVLAARLHAEDSDEAPAPRKPSRSGSPELPPATPGVLAELNARLGGQHFSYAAVPGG